MIKQAILLTIIAVAVGAALVGLLLPSNGGAIPATVDANSVDSCHFINDDNDTGIRSKHLNGYNVCVTAAYMEKVLAAEPYPSDITDSLDRKMHIEQLRRFQDPNKIGYMYLLGMNGNIVTWYTISGKPSSTQSSLTPSEQTSDGDKTKVVIPSAADDGSYGPNEGGDAGVLFFTASGCMIEHAPTWIYSDCPLNIQSSPVTIATLDAGAKPSSAIDQEFGGQ